MLAGALAAAASCGSNSDSAVVVDVHGSATLPGIFRLHAIVSNGGTSDSKMFPLTPPAQAIALPTAFSITLPRGRSGEIDLALDALDANGEILANGAGFTTINVGGTAEVTITLTAGAALCGNGHLDDGEGCDDGDRITNGACDFRCRPIVGDAGADMRGSTGGAGGSGVGGSGVGGSGAGGSGAGGAARAARAEPARAAPGRAA